MSSPTSQPDRVQILTETEPAYDPQSVLYVMSRDLRLQDNAALTAAAEYAERHGLPLVVLFVMYDKRVGQRAAEHMHFILGGLRQIAADCERLAITFGAVIGKPGVTWQKTVETIRPAAVFFDFNPLHGPRYAQERFAETAACPVYRVDAHNVIPVWTASDHLEVGARTLRPKIHRLLAEYLQAPLPVTKRAAAAVALPGFPVDWRALERFINETYPSNGTDISRFKPGEAAAHTALDNFMAQRLRGYAVKRNDPTVDGQSELSPYLHYGMIAALRVALEVQASTEPEEDKQTLIEELIVRKELADNWCYYNPHYLEIKGGPAWAQRTLAKHADDPREFSYSDEALERGETHDEAWNAAQLQLIRTGKMHGYMRMYWAKKVLEWSETPEKALELLIYWNDFYSIDGGDPNGYVGIMWSIVGVHDRPWGERPVYGSVRSMVYNGLRRKFPIQSYIDRFN